ncbi:hypothetical protein FBU59_002135 [Linderina macrospora]|uniref:Uncharacterized protein n=1 Tax=Linderina macrospora TaxID=4868 RepID=A0ACC1JC81_9FUNG|nr:hypothetical protein FBU59_002135 [Linderina macrospora]
MFVDTFELSCFVPSRQDGRALETRVEMSQAMASESPAATGFSPHHAIVFLHPYPPLGGQFRNNVVHELNGHYAKRIALAVSFNLRGAGRSEGGTSWTGLAEQEDLRTVLDALAQRRLPMHAHKFLKTSRRSTLLHMQARGFLDADTPIEDMDHVPLPPISHVLLCGYSYGSVVASAISPDEYPQLSIDYAYVSFPYSVLWALTLHRKSWYLQHIEATITAAAIAFASNGADANAPRTIFVSGTSDTFTSISSYERWWTGLRARATLAVTQALAGADNAEARAGAAVERALATVSVQNADHGWCRRETDVSDALDRWWP